MTDSPRYRAKATLRFLVFLAAFSFVTCLSVSSAAIRAKCCDFKSNKKPIWEFALPLPEPESDEQCEWSTQYRGDVVFTSSNDIVLGGIHFDCFEHDLPGSASRNLEVRHTRDFIARIDAQSGKLLNILTWDDVPTAEDIQVVATGDGQFLVRLGPVLKLFSSELKELKSRRLSLSAVNGNGELNWAVHVSPDGRTGLLQHWWDRFHEDHWFSTDTLVDTLVEQAPREIWRSTVITDSAVYYAADVPPAQRKGVEPPVYVRKQGEREGHQLCSECYGLPERLMPDGTLIVATGPNASFMLINPAGAITHRETHGMRLDDVGGVVAAANASRFAFGFGHIQTFLGWWKAKSTIMVFDTNRRKVVLELKLNQHPEENDGGQSWYGIARALSPNGEKAALLSGSVVKLFAVPQ